MQVTNLISLSTIIILLAFGQVRAESTNLDKFVGDWNVSITMNYNGQQIRSTAIQSIKKVGNDYISETSTNIPGQASGVGTVWFYASGALAGVSQSNGSTFTVSGTWYSSGNSFYWSGRQQGVNILRS